jgi:hypothetical protein
VPNPEVLPTTDRPGTGTGTGTAKEQPHKTAAAAPHPASVKPAPKKADKPAAPATTTGQKPKVDFGF